MKSSDETQDPIQAKCPKGWVCVGGALVLSEASFLAAELDARKISCRIYSGSQEVAVDKPLHFVLVPSPKQQQAVQVRDAVLQEDPLDASTTHGPRDNRWGKAGIAGVLGLLFGARLGSRGAWWAPFVLALACFALAFLWPEVLQE